MMIETVLSRSLRMMFASGAAVGLSLVAQQALAQTAPADESKMTRVEITGSSIKRIAAEGSLPVQTLTRSQIDQSGATNVADLVAALPAMQGFITSSTSVNGGGGGVQTASVHAIGTDYTLVLLNGRRMAPYGTGSAVNLASIPLSAVERVEILTDGASTLYGSDAIAGVVNFILKKNQRDLHIEATYNSPQKEGGKSANFSISKGFGDLETDRFNVLLAYSHDEQKELNAKQREFAKSGVRRFSEGGRNYTTWQTSVNSTPANVDVETADDYQIFSVDLLKNGKCSGANTFVAGTVCRYDYASTVQLLPKLKRDSLFASANVRVGDNLTMFGELVASKFSNEARYAPAAQPLSPIVTDPVTGVTTSNPNYIGAYNRSVLPLLAGLGINPADVLNSSLYYRGHDAGGRTDKYSTDALHAVLGLEGKLMGFDFNAAYTHSTNTQKDTAVAGYLSGNAFEALIAQGAYNPYELSANDAATLKPAVLTSVLNETKSTIDVLSARGSRELFGMGGGNASLGMGADFTQQRYTDMPSAILQGPNPSQPTFTDVIIGGGTGALPLDATRQNWGAFAEVLMPLTKTLEATAAVRYDSYDAVERKNTSYDVAGKAVGPGTVGNDVAKATYKLSARWTPVSSVLVRGSYGTGFKAPTMNDIADPQKNGGSSNFFACPFAGTTDPRAIYCKPGASEYGLLTSGNPLVGGNGLAAETSKQATIGFRVEPAASFSFGLDLWDVKLKNQIQSLAQQQIFSDRGLAEKWISVYFDPIQKANVLVATLSPVNLASSHYQGIDWDTTYRLGKTAIGNFALNWTGTYMLKAEQDVPGSATGIEYSIGRFDSYSNVTFRVISRAVLSLRSSQKYLNSLTFNYRSGYHDQSFAAGDGAVREVNANGSFGTFVDMARDVKQYMTVDYQLKASLNKNLTLTAGVKNLLDEDPPLSVRNAGGGNQVGYDGRYTDPLGRTFYLTAGYKF